MGDKGSDGNWHRFLLSIKIILLFAIYFIADFDNTNINIKSELSANTSNAPVRKCVLGMLILPSIILYILYYNILYNTFFSFICFNSFVIFI